MTTYKITVLDSRFSGTIAFDDHSSGADGLTVDDGAYLSAFGDAVDLDSLGAWTVAINGDVYSYSAYGIWLKPGNAASSTITIGASGEVGSNSTFGMEVDSSATIKNAGTISGTKAIVINGGTTHSITNTGIIDVTSSHTDAIVDNSPTGSINTISNSGTINSNIRLANSKVTVVNTGTINGFILSGSSDDSVTNSGTMNGVDLGDGNNKYTATATGFLTYDLSTGAGNDTITVMTARDINLGSGLNTLKILAGGAVSHVDTLGGADTVTNAGSITGGIDLGDGTNVFTNSNMVTADFQSGLGDDKFTNSGNYTGNVKLGNGTNTFTNSGIFSGKVTGGNLTDTLTNSKTMYGVIDLGNGLNVINNTGIMGSLTNGQDYITLGSDADHVTNSGTMAFLVLGDGENVVTNKGTIEGLTGGAQTDTVINNGQILYGPIDLYAGDDHYTGSKYVDNVFDGAGSDTIKLGDGNDLYHADPSAIGDGVDYIDGGTGIDTYIVDHLYGSGGAGSSGNVVINIDKIAHAEPLIAAAVGIVAANTATGLVGTDTVLNFENVTAYSGDEVIFGNAAANIILTGYGSDGLFGYGGNDTLNSGQGVDAITGGAGADILYGGGADHAADQFIYQSVTDSGPLKAQHDKIMDFEDGYDKINLSLIDADSKTTGLQHFSFIGTNAIFTPGTAGQLRVLDTPTGHTVEADINGDGKADLAIDIVDPTHTMSFSALDFVLI